MNKEQIVWGIIGCGDVAERKSGPAFQRVTHSSLQAVMRRDGVKARSFAKRHGVPDYYDSAEELLKDSRINAVYIATPPSTHLEYALKALDVGKNVYLEKPMVMDAAQAQTLVDAVNKSKNKTTIAHYRRALPAFVKIKEWLDDSIIGKVLSIDLRIFQAQQSDIIANTEENWRIDPSISGGGYFFDLAPHQLDLMIYYFGDFEEIMGVSENQLNTYPANDLVSGIITFKNKIIFSGLWAFNVHPSESLDECTIFGTNGSIRFSFYGDQVVLNIDGNLKTYNFENPEYIQQPMIQNVVNYFRGVENNPCTVEDGKRVIDLMTLWDHA